MKLFAAIRSLWDEAYFSDLVSFSRTGAERTRYACFAHFLDVHFQHDRIPDTVLAAVSAECLEAAMRSEYIVSIGKSFFITARGEKALFDAYTGWLY